MGHTSTPLSICSAEPLLSPGLSLYEVRSITTEIQNSVVFFFWFFLGVFMSHILYKRDNRLTPVSHTLVLLAHPHNLMLGQSSHSIARGVRLARTSTLFWFFDLLFLIKFLS